MSLIDFFPGIGTIITDFSTSTTSTYLLKAESIIKSVEEKVETQDVRDNTLFEELENNIGNPDINILATWKKCFQNALQQRSDYIETFIYMSIIHQAPFNEDNLASTWANELMTDTRSGFEKEREDTMALNAGYGNDFINMNGTPEINKFGFFTENFYASVNYSPPPSNKYPVRLCAAFLETRTQPGYEAAENLEMYRKAKNPTFGISFYARQYTTYYLPPIIRFPMNPTEYSYHFVDFGSFDLEIHPDLLDENTNNYIIDASTT